MLLKYLFCNVSDLTISFFDQKLNFSSQSPYGCSHSGRIMAGPPQLLLPKTRTLPDAMEARGPQAQQSRLCSFRWSNRVIHDDAKIAQLYIESALRKLRIFNSDGV